MATKRCTTSERQLLDRLYEKHPELKADPDMEFEGWYCDWQVIIDLCSDDPACAGGYAQSPKELIHAIINERDELRALANMTPTKAERTATARMIAAAQAPALFERLDRTPTNDIPVMVSEWAKMVASAAAILHNALEAIENARAATDAAMGGEGT